MRTPLPTPPFRTPDSTRRPVRHRRPPRTVVARVAPFAAAIALSLATAPASADTGLSVRLTAGELEGELRLELFNDGDEPVRVLRTGTALDTVLAEDAFELRRTVKGWPAVERPAYVGRHYKRAPPGPDDFVELAPEETVTSTVALANHYDVTRAGDYRVRFDGTFRTVADGAPFDDPSVSDPGAGADPEAPELASVVPDAPDGALELTLRPNDAGPRARPPAYAGCSAARQYELASSVAAAERIAVEARDALVGLAPERRAASPRYTRWFGAWTDARYADVTADFEAIAAALTGRTLTLDCTCDEPGVFAYVYTGQPYDIYLCPTFFSAATLGTDSRAGTLVHELSHFTAVAGTEDHRYGQSAVAALAASDPALSVDNADSMEYFAENTPALAMDDGSDVPAPGPFTPTTPTPTTPTTPAPVTTPPGDDATFVPLSLDVPVRGTLAAGDTALFRIDGADTVSLTSRTGDADLYVFDDPTLESDPVCAAAAHSASSKVDACELDSADRRYVAVVGFEAADYEVVASGRPGIGPTNVPDTGTDGGVTSEGADPGPVDANGDADSGGGAVGWPALLLAAVAGSMRRRGSPPSPGPA